MSVCDECKCKKPNVGPWQDGRRLCGGCKVRITLSRPGRVAQLERELGAALGEDVTIEVASDWTDESDPETCACEACAHGRAVEEGGR